MTTQATICAQVLAWYDKHARDLPWRVPPARSKSGQRPDPYHVWLSEVMLQQTTVAAVGRYFRLFTSRWPDVHALAHAEDGEVMAAWAGLGYYARARNLLACARVVSHDFGGVFPQTRQDLQALPGIGPYTSAAIAAIAFGQAETVVDGNVERVMARLFAVNEPLPGVKPRLRELADALTPNRRAGDYAQGLMDIGATICTPRRPVCALCPLMGECRAYAQDLASELPRRVAKTPKPVRFGVAYVVRRNDGALLLERRPNKGLLGGMLGWPGSDWSAEPTEAPPLGADWQVLGDEVRHTFTHFHLRLTVKIASVGPEALPVLGEFLDKGAFSPGDLPTVMRKVHDLACLEPALSRP
ncbi:MAG: A/G-specific adenine glycosylase [Alphaproteobacteria bacterium]|nr:A/G-specific adenine glycosylase [Alphaproteobacteria bacterium]